MVTATINFFILFLIGIGGVFILIILSIIYNRYDKNTSPAGHRSGGAKRYMKME